MEDNVTRTKGNIIVENIKIGDIHYEYEYGICIKSEVLTLPKIEGEGLAWKSKQISTGKIINYFVHPEYSHYSANLYDYPAYNMKEI